MFPSNLADICRLCLCDDKPLVNIIDESRRDLFDKVVTCLPISLFRDDKLPKNVCSECYYKVNAIHDFWNITLRSQSQIIKWLGDEVDDNRCNTHNSTGNTTLRSMSCANLSQLITLRSQSQIIKWLGNEVDGDHSTDNTELTSVLCVDSNQVLDKDTTGNDQLQDEHDENHQVCDSNNTNIESERDADKVKATTNNEDSDSDVEFICIERPPADQIKLWTKNNPISNTINTFNNVNCINDVSSGSSDTSSLNISLSSDASSDEYEEYEYDDEELNNNSLSDLSRIFQVLNSPEEIIDPPSMRNRVTPKSSTHRSPSNVIAHETFASNCDGTVFESYENIGLSNCNNKNGANNFEEPYYRQPEEEEEQQQLGREQHSPSEPVTTTACYRCETCSKVFSSRDILAMHKLSSQCSTTNQSTNGDGNNYESTSDETNNLITEQQTDNGNTVLTEDHHNQHHRLSRTRDSIKTNTKKEFCCDKCGTNFRYRKTFETHVKIHDNEKPITDDVSKLFTCKVCEQRFYTRNCYIHHARSHNLKAKTKKKKSCKLICFVCNKTYTSKRMLSHHLRTVCRRDTSYDCQTCGKELLTKESLECHKLIHGGAAALICQTCGKTFAHRKYFVVHQRIHTGERPYRCVTCGKTFTQASTLTVHRRYHTGERPYKCDICSKGFVTRTIMMSHLKYHKNQQQQQHVDQNTTTNEKDA